MIIPQTLRQLAGLSSIPASLGESVVLVIDAQNEYSTGALPLDGIEYSVCKLAAFLEVARTIGTPVIHIVHHGAPGGALFDPKKKSSEIIDAVKPQGGEQVIVKAYPSSFTGTILLPELQRLEKKDLVIAGYMTHMCVNSTTREAVEKGFRCTIAESLTATRDLPDGQGGIIPAATVKQVNLASLADRFAIVVPDVQSIPQ